MTLTELATTQLIEDLARYRRYGDAPGQAKVIRERYANQCVALEAELRRRGKDPDVLGLPVVAPSTPCRLRPLGDHVVVLPTAAKDVTEGGIIVPDSAKEVPVEGELLAVGPGRVEPGVGTVLPAVSVGDVVLFGRYSGVTVQLDGQAVLIMREEDLLGVLAPKAES